MIDSIITWSVKNKYIIILFALILFVLSVYSLGKLRIDALPDLTPPQVVLQVDFPNQSPKTIQEQVTYPLVSSLTGISNVESVRGISGYESALIYVIFKDKTDLYWARSRILEQLNQISNIPQAAKISLGSDSTSVGWAYQYALISQTKNLAELKTLQDFYYKYALLGIEGVSEVASIGGFVQDYEVSIDNAKMVRYDVSLQEVIEAIKRANNDSGGGVIVEGGFEKLIKANGYIQNEQDLENVIIKTIDSIPLRIQDIGSVNLTPKPRRGASELNGEGEVVGGIVMVKYGGNTYETLKKIKQKVASLNQNNSEVKIQAVYDRSELIEKAIWNLAKTLIEESLIVLIVVAIFLLHFRSALVIIITLPLCICITFLLMRIFDIESNIMSLGGIAIAIGAMIDASIVLVENAHKALSQSPNLSSEQRQSLIIKSSKQVGSAIFFALMIVVVSFLPIFSLNGQEERLFSPLAWTKTFAMLTGAFLAISIVPVCMLFFLKGRIRPQEANPLNRFCIKVYEKALVFALRIKWIFLGVCMVLLVLGGFVYKNLSWEFMPQIDEGVLMYMPVSNVAPSIDTGLAYLKEVDTIIKGFDEVESVFGKVGRANTSSDSAPLSMLEVYIHLKPKHLWKEQISVQQLRDKLESALQIQGLTNSWTYPIRGRSDMLLTGIRTPLGIKLYGKDTQTLQSLSLQIESKLKSLQESLSVFAERTNSGYYIELDIDDAKIARYGVSKDVILSTLDSALGGATITTKIDGVESYPISVRFLDTQRNDIESIKEIYIKTAFGFRPLRELAYVSYTNAASELKSENGLGVNYIYITPKFDISAKTYTQIAQKALEEITLPQGYYYEFSGESQYLQKALETLQFVAPFSVFIICVLVFFALKNWSYTLLCVCSLPFAIIGGLFMIEILGYNLSIAGIVGLLALLGVASETSIVMFIYLEHAFSEVTLLTPKTLLDSVLKGAAQRVRPKLMTVLSIIASLIPIMYAQGVGSEITKAIAAPMLGGMISSALLTLFIIPICFYILKSRQITK